MKDDRMIQKAILTAHESKHSKWQLGAVIVQGSRILARSPNKLRNPPWIDHNNSTRHAEMSALARCLLAAPGAALSM